MSGQALSNQSRGPCCSGGSFISYYDAVEAGLQGSHPPAASCSPVRTAAAVWRRHLGVGCCRPGGSSRFPLCRRAPQQTSGRRHTPPTAPTPATPVCAARHAAPARLSFLLGRAPTLHLSTVLIEQPPLPASERRRQAAAVAPGHYETSEDEVGGGVDGPAFGTEQCEFGSAH